MTGSRTTLAALISTAVVLPMLIGCQVSSGIDPSGQRIFASPPGEALGGGGADDCRHPRFVDQPGPPPYWADTAVILRPQTVVAPVGSEVVLIAGVKGRDECLRTNRRLEWALASGSVGSFVEASSGGLWDYIAGDFTKRRKIDNSYIIGSTTRNGARLHRGTPSPEDDVYVRPGEGWVTLTSPLEGASFVSVFAPDVYPWNARVQSAVVHWIDCQWRCPPPAIRPSGTKHTLTTSVVRGRDQSPLVGWRVRYEIVGGPAAGFDPDGAATIEVTTDSAGTASADIFQKQLTPGLNTINIYVIRPGELPGSGGRPLVMRAGSTSVQWTAAAAAITISGPSSAAIGSTVSYTITVNNSGAQTSADTIVSQTLPDGVALTAAVPPAETSGRRLIWRLGSVAPSESRTIEASYRLERVGTLNLCSELIVGGRIVASDCATTTVGQSDVELRVSGPSRASSGDQLTFEIEVVNRTTAPLAGLTLVDTYDEGLSHTLRSPIRKRLDRTLAPGESSGPIVVVFTASRPGTWCHRVEVRDTQGRTLASQRACVEIGGTQPSPETGGSGGLPPSRQPELSVSKRGPEEATLGQVVLFEIDIVNIGTRVLTDLQVVDQYDSALSLQRATVGHRAEPGGLVWTIPMLRPGENRNLRVECRCERATNKACNRATVSSRDGVSASAEACLAIRASQGTPPGLFPDTRPGLSPDAGDTPAGDTQQTPAGALKLSLRAPPTPIAAGREIAYYIDLTNNGRQIERWITVEVELGRGLTPTPLGTRGPGTVRSRISGQKVAFDRLPELKPGETVAYVVRFKTGAPGQATITARATSQEQLQPVETRTTVQVASQ